MQMRIVPSPVALLPCDSYHAPDIKNKIDQLCNGAGFRVTAGARVLLKPNLLTARSNEHLACTHPAFVAAVAEWFIDHGAMVAIGDSPAFGTAKGVMGATGIAAALAGLPVELVNFDRSRRMRLSGGVVVDIARAALACDVLVNLPRIKAHSQLYVTLAVKNYFGTVVGFQKPRWHLRFGTHPARFASHIIDLLEVLPDGVTLVDGIVVMAGTGPVSGHPYPLNLVAASLNPVALDTALLEILGLDRAGSPLWQECAARGLAGADPAGLEYPLLQPAECRVPDFKAPQILKPVSFNPLRMMVSACRRFAARVTESS